MTSADDFLRQLGDALQRDYAENRRIMSYRDYLDLVRAQPRFHARDAAQYVKDLFDHYGTSEVDTPEGPKRRWKVFDVDFAGGDGRLVGQERVQSDVYRTLEHYVQVGRANKLILLHGPNGSAKSTLVSCIIRAAEDYSRREEGALYRFSWVFPTQRAAGGGPGIGFGGRGGGGGGGGAADPTGSFALLEDADVDARIPSLERDHPLFLLNREARRVLLEDALARWREGDAARSADPFMPSESIRTGTLSHRNRQIYEALLASYHGDLLRVLRHVQVERFYISRRYRVGVATVEPQLSVDARSRQLTMDRSISSLPPALQNLSLTDVAGELVDGNRGIIEYNDLLKRPLDTYKYLLSTTETGRVALEHETLQIDAVFIATSNDKYLEAFQSLAEFPSFKGRMELVRVPYLLDWRREQEIYAEHVKAVRKHVTPHTTEVAAVWAVLTRMRRPQADSYPKPLSNLVAKLTPLEKADLYANGRAPLGLDPETAKLLEGSVGSIRREGESYPKYEGRIGASAREMKTALLNAAQNDAFACLSPSALAVELEGFVSRSDVYEFLAQDVVAGYHDHVGFIAQSVGRYLDRADGEVRKSLGLVDESAHEDLFRRYVKHVSHYVKKERLRDERTGADVDPDAQLMKDVEKSLGVSGDADAFRHQLISRIAAYSLEHAGKGMDYANVFPQHLERLRRRYYEERRTVVARGMKSILKLTGGEAQSLDAAERAQASGAIEKLRSGGYCDHCARETVALLLRERYA